MNKMSVVKWYDPDTVDTIQIAAASYNVKIEAVEPTGEPDEAYVCVPDCEGKMTDSGLGRILNDLVDGAYDTGVVERENKIAKDKSKKAHEEAVAAAKARGPKVRYSIAGTLERINKLLDKADCDPDGVKNVLDKVTKIFKD